MTGHWPVVNECDFAHPRPSRIDRLPTFAASSMPPGSPVTYSPGMPSWPPARVTSMIELSTVAGASWSASFPWPRASKPTASTAASTSGTPRICSICCGSGVSLVRSTVSHPKLSACFRRSLIMSPTITTAAPRNCAECAAASPAGLDHLAGDLVAEDKARRRRRAAADHVLVRTADVGRNDPEDDAVLALAADVSLIDPWSVLENELGVVDGLDLDLPGFDVGNSFVTWHHITPLCSREGCADTPSRDGKRARRRAPELGITSSRYHADAHRASDGTCRSPEPRPAPCDKPS